VGFREIKDTDGDGTPDSLDLDKDNDGIPDSAELKCVGSASGTGVWDPAVATSDLSATFTLDTGVTGTFTTNANNLRANFPTYTTTAGNLNYGRDGANVVAAYGNETIITFNAPVMGHTFSLNGLGSIGDASSPWDESQEVTFLLNGSVVALYPTAFTNGGFYVSGVTRGVGNSPQGGYEFTLTSPVDEIRIKHVGGLVIPAFEGYTGYVLSTTAVAPMQITTALSMVLLTLITTDRMMQRLRHHCLLVILIMTVNRTISILIQTMMV